MRTVNVVLQANAIINHKLTTHECLALEACIINESGDARETPVWGFAVMERANSLVMSDKQMAMALLTLEHKGIIVSGQYSKKFNDKTYEFTDQGIEITKDW